MSSVNTKSAVAQQRTTETHIDELPNEMMAEIFGYIPKLQLFFSVAQVSRRWRELALQRKFWKQIELPKSEELSTARACCILRTIGCVTSELSVYDRTDTDTILNEVSKHNMDLSVLSLFRCTGQPKYGFIGGKAMKSVITRLPHLTTIRLYSTAFRSVEFFGILGSEQLMRDREKEARRNNLDQNEAQYPIAPIQFIGVMTCEQLEAYVQSLLVNKYFTGQIKFADGRQYTVERLGEILHKTKLIPNTLIRLF